MLDTKRLLLALFVATSLGAGAETGAEGSLLADQFGRTSQVGAGGGRASLVFVSDRADSGELVEHWARSLAPLPDSLDVQVVADLRALPFFVPRGFVVAWLAGTYPRNPILLDWGGDFSKAAGAKPNEVTVLVYDPAGRLLARGSGSPTPATLAALRAALGRATEAGLVSVPARR